jgi:hypothetical protein
MQSNNFRGPFPTIVASDPHAPTPQRAIAPFPKQMKHTLFFWIRQASSGRIRLEYDWPASFAVSCFGVVRRASVGDVKLDDNDDNSALLFADASTEVVVPVASRFKEDRPFLGVRG